MAVILSERMNTPCASGCEYESPIYLQEAPEICMRHDWKTYENLAWSLSNKYLYMHSLQKNEFYVYSIFAFHHVYCSYMSPRHLYSWYIQVFDKRCSHQSERITIFQSKKFEFEFDHINSTNMHTDIQTNKKEHRDQRTTQNGAEAWIHK